MDANARLVLVAIWGVCLATAAAALAGAGGKPWEAMSLEEDEFAAAMETAPWLAGIYGARGEQEEADGFAVAALQDYSRVLACVPGHPGTSLARARVLARFAGAGDRAARALALEDLAAAERGWLRQRALLDGRAPATAASLNEIERVRAALGPH